MVVEKWDYRDYQLRSCNAALFMVWYFRAAIAAMMGNAMAAGYQPCWEGVLAQVELVIGSQRQDRRSDSDQLRGHRSYSSRSLATVYPTSRAYEVREHKHSVQKAGFFLSPAPKAADTAVIGGAHTAVV